MAAGILSQLGKKNMNPKTERSKAQISRIPSNVKSNSHNFHIQDNLIRIVPKDGIIKDNKIFAFDLDSTLIKTKSGRTFSTNSNDWQWCFNTVVKKLIDISRTNSVIIFSNQGGVITDSKDSKSMIQFLSKINKILQEFEKNGVLDIWIYTSTKQSSASKKKGINESKFLKNRKPETGLFEEFKKDYLNSLSKELNKSNIIYIGDAAGRPNDFSDSDLKFAKNCGIEFKIPEDFF